MHQHFLAFGSEARSELAILDALEPVDVHEIRNHMDFLLHIVHRVRFHLEKARNRSNVIAPFDRKFYEGEKAWLKSDKRDVGTVKRRNHLDVFGGREYLFSYEGARRVRNCVVNVQYIEIVIFSDVDHLAGQRIGVKREVEQRILRHLDFVEEYVADHVLETHRHRVADKMDLMASLCERLTELGCDYTASAVCWITSNSDFQLIISLGKIIHL